MIQLARKSIFPDATSFKKRLAWKSRFLLFFILLTTAGAGINPAIAQQLTVTGTVTSSTGEPLTGATVLLKGTSTAAATDINGKFTLNVPDRNGVLVASYIGFVPKEVPINGQSTLNIALGEDAKALEEVVVVGYGTQRKSDLTGSVTSVSSEEFNRGQNTTPEQLIQGKVAGVQITSNGGAPGAGSQIRIRGGSSLNANNNPLIVIDGVPLDNTGVAGTANPLSMINPNDIETFNVLKDASATAIYGSRASNGVIIITTKKGQSGKMRVNFSTLATVSEVNKTLELLSADQYREVVNQYAPAGNKALLGNANTNWQDLIYRTALSTDNNLSLSGTYKNLPYRVSLGYLDQNGILKTSNMKRSSAALTLNPTFLDDHLKVNMNVRGIFTKSNFADEGAIGAAVNMDPTQPVYANNNLGGYFEWVDANGNPISLAPRNPLSMLEQRTARGEARRSIGNLQLDYKFHFLPELRANLNVGYDISNGEGYTRLPTTLASVYARGGSNTQYEQSKTNKLLDFYLNYTKDLENIKSRVDFTAGYSYQDFLREEPSFPEYSAEGTVLTPAALNPFKTQNTLVSFFGRLNYALLDRYLFTATIRRDGSSRFSPENRWGTFPALAFAWRIIEEPFLKDVTALTDLKLRVGYGVTGQQEIGEDYPYLARYVVGDNTVGYQFGNQFYNTWRPAGFDPNIKWEETTTYNAGIDFGLWNNRITGTIDYYHKKTKDLLATIPPAAGTNLTNTLYTNVGSLENKGLEFGVNVKAITKPDFTWDFSFNATFNRNEITNLSKTQDTASVGQPVGGVAGGTGNTVQIHTVGYPTFSYYLFKQVYDENGRPMEGFYVDLNNDGVINEKDLYRYKSPAPLTSLGFSSQVAYKKLSMSFTMRANLGNYVFNNTRANAVSNNVTWAGYLLNIPSSYLETRFTGVDDRRLRSDLWVENASFLRLDNINLSYDFGRVMKERVGLRLSASAQNVFTITKYSGLDPEVASGIDNNFYPRPRMYSLGLNLEF
ncbi:SusC/RagA family TonB-linked outer membrane protein [Sabulibacter ruber]|uniref:SusC/RagA family TonB-linked outer membrane protein n=1 Tax=Sabulibacter ruber TaxID=2811901 RepID=UPI001A962486|nr:TonB-dependent receptor [Sabulibacter ruber]